MSLLALTAELGSWIVIAAMALTLLRLALGPTIADRAVALELLSALVVSFAALRAAASGVSAYLDVATALAVTGFLATLAFARYVARRGRLAARPGGEGGGA